MPGTSSLAVVLGGMAVLWGGVHLAVRNVTTPDPARPPSDAAPPTAAAALIGVALALTAPATGQPMYWAAAAVAALSTATGVGLAREIATVAGEPTYTLPTLSIATKDAPGSISAAAALAAATGAFATATLAFQVRLIGPSDAAAIAASAFAATLFECWLAGIWTSNGPARLAPAALAALAAGGLGAAFVVLLP